MKIPYKHFLNNITSRPSIEELSDKLLQLGHEHEIIDNIFDIELTPNRGDCLSLDGLLRDLKLFYDIPLKKDIFEDDIKPFRFEFINNAKESCSRISFVLIEIDQIPENYSGSLKNYFIDLNLKRINFFTDVSNFILYETGQPTHCYDYLKILKPIKLNFLKKNCKFETLLDKQINLEHNDLAFFDKNDEIINLAGVVGGKKTSCNENTKTVLLECAHFDPEVIIGKSVKYDINSDAAYNYERGTDPECHEYVIRRFINIVNEHTNITNIEKFEGTITDLEKTLIPFEVNKINRILGASIDDNDCRKYLEKLGFFIDDNNIGVPSYRNDIKTLNDISEEIARAIGYDNIKPEKKEISAIKDTNDNISEKKIKKLLVENGFYEVINNPFVEENINESVVVDNPLDSNKKFLRTNLKNSLLKNLLYNERRQKDSVKLFEISDLYSNLDKGGFNNKVIGIIASGRIDKNYLDFSKQMDIKYFDGILSNIINANYQIEEIPRKSVDSKLKNKIIFCEIELEKSYDVECSHDQFHIRDLNYKKYEPISEFPSSHRDLSFSIKDYSKCKLLEEVILNFNHSLLREIFVFDYFKNEKLNEIKIGFRFIFQSNLKTITDEEVNKVINEIISVALSIDSVNIPGLSNW